MSADFIDNANKAVQSNEVYASDEFIALCKKFNIQWDLGTRSITISLPRNDAMVVIQEYITKHPSNCIDTTTHHNKDYVTHEPLVDLNKE